MEAEKNMVFAARLTQQGHKIASMDDLMDLYEKSFSVQTVAAMGALPHPISGIMDTCGKPILRATAPISTTPLSQAKPSMSIAPRLKPPSVAALTSLSRSLPRVRAQPRN